MKKVFTGLNVNLKAEEVLRLQGYRKGRDIKGRVKELLKVALKEGASLITPRAIAKVVAVKKMEEGRLRLAGGYELKVGKAARSWEGAQQLAAVFCTIGPALEERVEELFRAQDFAQGLMLDSVGSAAVESLADEVNYFFCQEARRQGWGTGPRLSPGYGEWELTDQKVLFALLPGEEIGIKLNAQCMMLPRKSVSFCLGMGIGFASLARVNPCLYCGLKYCSYRRK